MPRHLHLDVARGASAASLLAALVDLGVAPSPLLHAVADLGLPVELRIEGARVEARPERGGVLVRPLEVDTVLARAGMPTPARLLVDDAVGRLLVAEGGGHPIDEHGVDATALALLAACALAVADLAPERVLVSRVGVEEDPLPPVVHLLADEADALDFGAGATTSDGAALLRALVPEGGFGQPEPAWRGPVMRGEGGEPRVRAALGEA